MKFAKQVKRRFCILKKKVAAAAVPVVPAVAVAVPVTAQR